MGVEGLCMLRIIDWMEIDSRRDPQSFIEDPRNSPFAEVSLTSDSRMLSPSLWKDSSPIASPKTSAWCGNRSTSSSWRQRRHHVKSAGPLYLGGLPYAPRAAAATRTQLPTLKTRHPAA